MVRAKDRDHHVELLHVPRNVSVEVETVAAGILGTREKLVEIRELNRIGRWADVE
jgi:hypothetical protein